MPIQLKYLVLDTIESAKLPIMRQATIKQTPL